MGEMASALAHELNQPLSALTNYLKGSRQLLAKRDDKESAMIRDALEKAAEHLCERDRSFAVCAISSVTARPRSGSRAPRSWSRRPARLPLSGLRNVESG